MTSAYRSIRRLASACAVALALLAVTAPAVTKPTGTYSSSGAAGTGIYANSNLRGALVHVNWSDVEPTLGVFNFSSLAFQVSALKNHGLGWSLAVNAGGPGSPRWLIDTLGAPYVDYSFRSEPGFRLPLFWDATVQERLRQLAVRLALEYNTDPSLRLVYVSQMTANGIEGHLQGVDMNRLVAAGYTDAKWIAAAEQTARNFAMAFADKALAFEVHEINGGATVPATIINDLWNDPSLGQRVGAAMWWISGKTSYQPALIDVLTVFPGDVYGQSIARSDQTDRFQDGDFATMFAQAKAIGLRYLEPWEYEFKYGTNTANGRWDAVMADFNAWADATFAGGNPPPPPAPPPRAPTGLVASAGDRQVALDWADNTEANLAGYSVIRGTTAGGPYTELTTTLLTASKYTDTTVTNGTTYYYVVTAADLSANESTRSAEVSARPVAPTPPPAPAPTTGKGGGGAVSGWFVTVVLSAFCLRRWQSRFIGRQRKT